MKKFIYFICLFLLVLCVPSCNNSKKNSNPIEDNEEYNNVYSETAEEFHVSTWIPAPSEAFEITELENNELNVRYNKSIANNYCFI